VKSVHLITTDVII